MSYEMNFLPLTFVEKTSGPLLPLEHTLQKNNRPTPGESSFFDNANTFFSKIERIECSSGSGPIELTVNDGNCLEISREFKLKGNSIIVSNGDRQRVVISLPKSIIESVNNGTIKTTMKVESGSGPTTGVIMLPGDYSTGSGALNLKVLTQLGIEARADRCSVNCRSRHQKQGNLYVSAEPNDIRGRAKLSSSTHSVVFSFEDTISSGHSSGGTRFGAVSSYGNWGRDCVDSNIRGMNNPLQQQINAGVQAQMAELKANMGNAYSNMGGRRGGYFNH
ncbi:hypothetical protein N9V90_02685 [Endozoicomonas sp.]|nr:hypothetical protein [Endozoicomonas sp.]